MNLTTKEKIDLLKYVRNSLLEDLDSCFFRRGICHYGIKYTEHSIKDTIPDMRFELYLTGSNIRVRFDSEEQAIMFFYKINLPENKELRNYFINLLKN